MVNNPFDINGLIFNFSDVNLNFKKAPFYSKYLFTET